jgi:release factor glutamine methyltransferase
MVGSVSSRRRFPVRKSDSCSKLRLAELSDPSRKGAALVRDALGAAKDAFEAVGIESPAVDARLLLAEVSGRSVADLIVSGTETITPSQARQFSESVRRRLRREPVAYIVGRKGFRHIELDVDPRVLVPRPETEMLVEFAVLEQPESVLEIGTGSGAVSLAIASEVPGCRVTAGDISTEALEVARSNAGRLGLTDRVRFFEGTWPAPGSFDLIVANLPYVASGDDLPPEVRDWEPPVALYPGESGLECFEQVLGDLPKSGIQTPVIALETGCDQGLPVARLLEEAGFAETAIHTDLAGLDRMVTGRRQASTS